MFHVNPVERPYFWCGGDDVGLMGGSDTRHGWHLRDKAKGLQVVHQDKTITLNLNLVDTPLLLKAPRSLEFYLQPTPVKPKNMEMRGIRVRENMICWGEYVTLYFAHKRPGKFSERHLKYFREQQEKHGKRVFYYNAPKGASPVSPEWNYFGMEWHCSPPRLGNTCGMPRLRTVRHATCIFPHLPALTARISLITSWIRSADSCKIRNTR